MLRAHAARRVSGLTTFLLFLFASGVVYAHERFVKHNLRYPLHNEFFGRWPGKPLGLHPDMMMIALRVAGILGAFFAVWFLRRTLTEIIERSLLRRIGGSIQHWGHKLACFLTDRPVRGKLFHALGEWAVILFLRSPGLVLMYSATNDSLVMPSYPLDPASASIFKFAQVGLAILILTQTWLPLCGAMIVGTWLYLFRWGWMVAVDAVPVLTVAVVYCTSPWQSHKLAITKINALADAPLAPRARLRLPRARLAQGLQPQPRCRRRRQRAVGPQRPDGRDAHRRTRRVVLLPA